MTRPGREPTTYRVRGGHANHQSNPTQCFEKKFAMKSYDIQAVLYTSMNWYLHENKIKAPTRWHCVTLQVQAYVQS